MSIVREFHEAFGQEAPAAPPLRADPALLRLRIRLINEEAQEVAAELQNLIYAEDPKLVLAHLRALLKELADLRYVTEGCAVALGLPIEAAFAEVHRSNMSKLGGDGKPVYRADGKVLKGPNYWAPDMSKFVPAIPDTTYEED